MIIKNLTMVVAVVATLVSGCDEKRENQTAPTAADTIIFRQMKIFYMIS